MESPSSSVDERTRMIHEALASLQLPHSNDSLQSFRILVVADVDLSSASALAEYTLQQQNQTFDASRIDLCIACGPFYLDQDLLPYLKGKQKATRQHLQQSQPNNSNSTHHQVSSTNNTPFVRSREETVALEGLMTAALSQLESIVCRVVYCPGSTDPLSTLLSAKRLTPNSRNIHRKWLPLVPGLGCAALFYLDDPQAVLKCKLKSKATKKRLYEDEDPHDSYANDEPHDSEVNDEEDATALLTEQLIGIQQSSGGYCATLGQLLQLAPKPHYSIPLAALRSQTIMVTHYVHGLSQRPKSNDPCDNVISANGSPSWTTTESEMPWPAAHETLLQDNATQQHLCLEIASGSTTQHKPQVIETAASASSSFSPDSSSSSNSGGCGTTVLLPGSLRERGEFCLVDMALMDAATGKSAGSTPATAASLKAPAASKLTWRVKNVDFHRLDRFRAQS